MAIDYSSVLEGFGRTLQVTTSQGAPGQPVRATLAPLEFPPVQITEVVSGSVDVTWISQALKFSEVLADPAAPLLDLPELPPLDPPPSLPINEDIGTDGTLNRLRGKVPVPLQYEAPVGLQVSWRVTLDAAGLTPAPAPAPDAVPARWCLPLTPLNVPAPAFLFSVGVHELRAGPPASSRWYLWADVDLTLPLEDATSQRTIGPIAVDVPDIPVPTVLACFNHHSFAPMGGDQPGFVLAVVPNGSPLPNLDGLKATLQTANAALTTVRSTLDALGLIAAFANLAPVAESVSLVSSVIEAQPYADFAQADYLSNLSVFVFLRHIGGLPALTAEDSIGSLILIAPPGHGVELFNLRDGSPNNGFLEVRAGAFGATLVHGLGEVPPPTVPEGMAAGVIPATGYSFTNHLSSLRFGLGPSRDRLHAGESLLPGQRLVSANRRYALLHHPEGYLTLFAPGRESWKSPKAEPPGRATLQDDGHFVLYNPKDAVAWASEAYGFPASEGSYLVMQDDGNLVVYDGNNGPQWSTGTGP